MNPAVLRDYKFALTHTPTPHAVKLKFRAIRGRLRTVYALLKVSLSVYTFLSSRAAEFRSLGTANKSRFFAGFPFVDRQPRLQPQKRNF